MKIKLLGSQGTQIWFGRRCAAQASKPLSWAVPIFKGHFGQKVPIFWNFPQNVGPIPIFWGVSMANTWKCCLSHKNGHMFKDIFVVNGTHEGI